MKIWIGIIIVLVVILAIIIAVAVLRKKKQTKTKSTLSKEDQKRQDELIETIKNLFASDRHDIIASMENLI